MCTVSYIPHSGRSVLTSKRDEHVSRATSAIQEHDHDGIWLKYPQDPEAHGSWIGMAHVHLRYACLLNGAFVKHRRNPPYRLSRGILLLNALTYENGDDFLRHFSFNNIEPFTLILANPVNELEEIKWDGQRAHHILLNPQVAHLWCSPTLYNSPDRLKKEESFREMIRSQASLNNNTIKSWHETQYYEDTVEEPISEELRTLSITQVSSTGAELNLDHFSIIT